MTENPEHGNPPEPTPERPAPESPPVDRGGPVPPHGGGEDPRGNSGHPDVLPSPPDAESGEQSSFGDIADSICDQIGVEGDAPNRAAAQQQIEAALNESTRIQSNNGSPEDFAKAFSQDKLSALTPEQQREFAGMMGNFPGGDPLSPPIEGADGDTFVEDPGAVPISPAEVPQVREDVGRIAKDIKSGDKAKEQKALRDWKALAAKFGKGIFKAVMVTTVIGILAYIWGLQKIGSGLGGKK